MRNDSCVPAVGTQADDADRPVLSFVRGQPTEAEIAAVLAVLTVRARAAAALASASAPATVSRSTWSDRSRMMREPIAAVRGGWRASALPR